MRIVILPGLDGTAQLLGGLLDELAHNDIDIVSYPPTLASYSDILAFVQQQLPTDVNYIIVAESFSGPVAIQLAALKPAGLSGIVFVATFARRPMAAPSVFASIFKLIPIKSRLFTWAAQPMLMGRWRNATFTTKFHAALVDLPKSTLVNRVKEVLRVDVVKLLRNLDVPSVYLRPNQDRLVPLSASVPFPDIHLLDGPHFVLQACPKESAEIIREFEASIQQFSG